MENEKKEVKKEVIYKTYAKQKDLLIFLQRNIGKNFMFEYDVVDAVTGEVIKEYQKIVYEQHMDLEKLYIMDNYNDDLVYKPKNSNVIIIMKRVSPDIEDDIFNVRTAFGSSKREVQDLR